MISPVNSVAILCAKFQPVHSVRAMGITPANHFRRALSVDEIQRLRRLRSDGSPELLSRS